LSKFNDPTDLINYRAIEDSQEIARAFEMNEEFLDTVNNPKRIYLSEPFGFCSFFSHPFDDFELMLPHMMTKGGFDLDKTPKIKKIEIITQKGVNILGLRTTYRV
jgi:hypothetical protein